MTRGVLVTGDELILPVSLRLVTFTAVNTNEPAAPPSISLIQESPLKLLWKSDNNICIIKGMKDHMLVNRFYCCGISNVYWAHIIQTDVVTVITISHQQNVSCREIRLLQYAIYRTKR